MIRKYLYYIIFGFTFIFFNIVQENIRPNYEGRNSLIIYFLGVIPNFLPYIDGFFVCGVMGRFRYEKVMDTKERL